MAADKILLTLGKHAVVLPTLPDRVEGTPGHELVVGAGRSCGRVSISMNGMLGESSILTLVVRREIDSITPAVAALCEDVVAVGADMTVSLLSILEKSIQRQIRLSTPFRGFLQLGSGGLILIEEAGLRRLLSDGDVAWIVNTDLISRISHHDDVLVIEQFDAPTMRLRLEDGTVAAPM